MTKVLSPLRNLAAFAKSLLIQETGASLPLFGLLLIPMVAFIGLAVDTSRGYVVRARINNALDAAALASAHSVGTQHFQDDVEQYFYANFPNGYLGATVTLNPPQVTNGGRTVQLSASAQINTTLMRLLNYETLDVAASSTVTTGLASVDVVLSIDMSGSMGWSDGGSTRIESARDAAEILIDTLVDGTGNGNADGNVRFALVPWNSNVNVTDGSAYDPALTTASVVSPFNIVETPYSGGSQVVSQDRLYYANNSPVPFLTTPFNGWNGCAFARFIAVGGGGGGGDNDGAGGAGNNQTDDDDADFLRGQVSRPDSGLDWFGWEPKADNEQCLDHNITPLTTDYEAVRTEIRALLTPTGNTNIPQGLAWAWRVLMPGVPYEEAATVATGSHKRAIVLLSDGANSPRSSDSYRGQLEMTEMDERLVTIAQNAKNEGATIYVIQYAEDDAALQNLLKQVATEPASPYYNFAPNSDSLAAVFEGIAEDLTSELRIAQ